MTSSSSTFTSNSNLNREDSFTNLSDIIMGERAETFSTTSQMTDEEIKRKFDELTKRNDELSTKLKKLMEMKACFLKVSNKWKVYSMCCENRCVNNNPNTTCINGSGFIQIISNTNIKYNYNRFYHNANIEGSIAAENCFEKPDSSKLCLNCSTYTLYYYEIKLKIERGKPLIEIGLRYSNFQEIYFCVSGGYISYFNHIDKKTKFINLSSSFSFKNRDIIGCGVVYPNINNNKLPYIFFTKNGELIGKAIELKPDEKKLFPTAILKYCSIETNFGDDLNSKPFKYDITNHYVAKEYYEDEEFTD